MEGSTSSLEEWQASTNTKIADVLLKAESLDTVDKSLGDRLTVVEAGAWQSAYATRSPGKGGGYDALQGNPKDLPKWTGAGPFTDWKHVFVTGLNGIKAGLKELLAWVVETDADLK